MKLFNKSPLKTVIKKLKFMLCFFEVIVNVFWYCLSFLQAELMNEHLHAWTNTLNPSKSVKCL